jgi:two-component system, chemotaxis family, chemotaxis protein CheY
MSELSSRLKILVADNDSRWRRFVRSLLLPYGAVSECDDGASAVLAFHKIRPDWVIMDVAMEPMDGLSAVRKIKSDFPNARVIFLSQFSEPEFRFEAAQLGAVAYIMKDDIDHLEELIRDNTAPAPKAEPLLERRTLAQYHGS